MLASFLIMLREGLEAALVVGIIAGYLAQTGRRDLLPTVGLGVLLAIAASLFVGALVQLVTGEFPQRAQELFEAVVGTAATVILVAMVFWMRRASRSIRGRLHGSVDAALIRPDGGTWALVAMTFLAVGREGLESVFFMLAVIGRGGDGFAYAAPAGALLGVATAALLGFAFFRGAIRLDLRRFFRWTGIFILFVASGLAASVLRNLHEAGLWNLFQVRVFDLSDTLPTTSLVGTVLSGVFGYTDAPTMGEVVLYLFVLVASLTLFLKPDRVRAVRPTAEAS